MDEIVTQTLLPPSASTLDGLALPLEAGFSLVPAQVAARFILRGTGLGEALQSVLGAELPVPHGSAGDGDCRALWLGPDEWLLLARETQPEALAARLADALAGQLHAAVDVTHRQIGLVLEGRKAALVLASGCPLDLDARAFPVGMATRTVFHKAEIVLFRGENERFHVEIARSFVPYCVARLAEAARDARDL